MWCLGGEGGEGKAALQGCPDTVAFRLSLVAVAGAAEGSWLARRSEGADLLFTSWAGPVAPLSLVFAGKHLAFLQLNVAGIVRASPQLFYRHFSLLLRSK